MVRSLSVLIARRAHQRAEAAHHAYATMPAGAGWNVHVDLALRDRADHAARRLAQLIAARPAEAMPVSLAICSGVLIVCGLFITWAALAPIWVEFDGEMPVRGLMAASGASAALGGIVPALSWLARV